MNFFVALVLVHRLFKWGKHLDFNRAWELIILAAFRKWLDGNRAKGLLPKPLAIIGWSTSSWKRKTAPETTEAGRNSLPQTAIRVIQLLNLGLIYYGFHSSIQIGFILTFYTVFNTAMFTPFEQSADERQRNKNFIPLWLSAQKWYNLDVFWREFYRTWPYRNYQTPIWYVRESSRFAAFRLCLIEI